MERFFIIKCKDTTIQTKELPVSYWKYEDGDLCGLESDEVTPFDFELLYEDCDIDTIQIEEKDFQIESIDNESIKIVCKNLTYEDLNNMLIDYEEVKEDFNLKTRCKYLTFTEFKKLFDLKGTKKQLIENTPRGCELHYYTTSNNKRKYTLYKTIEENCMYVQYECQLGSY